MAVVVLAGLALAISMAFSLADDGTTTTNPASTPTSLNTAVTTTIGRGESTTLPTTTVPTTATTVSTTTSTVVATTTTTTTTVSPPPGNRPPTVSISTPAHLSSHEAAYDPGTGRFGATITFSASAIDPDGDSITIRWFSSTEGALGSGATITATIHTQGSDSTQPFITARVTDRWGATSTATIQIIVWIPSGT